MSTNTQRLTYDASCHCGAVHFKLTCAALTSGRRCNCSMCIRRGAVVSSSYLHPEDVEVDGAANLAIYQFGDRDMNHFFCRTCGIFPFSRVASLPPEYGGAARIGDYRINLGCVHDLDVYALDIEVMDGRSL